MDKLTKAEFNELAEKRSGGCTCVSIYMPVHKTGTDVQQNPARLKNLLGQAEDRLAASGLRSPAAQKLLAPAAALREDFFFWRQQSDGLAMFISEDFFRHYRLPVKFKETTVVADCFHIRPLIAVVNEAEKYYVLALSQKMVRLLECTRRSVREVALPAGVPRSLAEFLKFNDADRQRQFHGHIGTPGRAEESLASHGKEISEENKNNVLRYFQMIDRELGQGILKEGTIPLVLAGVEYIQAIYCTANTYRGLVAGSIAGNPDELTAEELQKRAWPIVQIIFERDRKRTIREYREFSGTGHTAADLATILAEARRGKVETLLVAEDAEQWGTFDPVSGRVAIHPRPEPCDADLLNLAVISTLAHRGTVHTIAPGDMPDGRPLAAVLRHEIVPSHSRPK
ncbi:MAG: hypothetical protein HY670_06005 [Chloroflexi bacterium]|nr:hypothetical protein [Chloroflexota bacterium]